jgi:hypothetical protein
MKLNFNRKANVKSKSKRRKDENLLFDADEMKHDETYKAYHDSSSDRSIKVKERSHSHSSMSIRDFRPRA